LIIAVVLTILLIVWPMLFLATFNRSKGTALGLTVKFPWSDSDD
jgi:ABC-type Mn2+/Zn2+ transport system permease subunit